LGEKKRRSRYSWEKSVKGLKICGKVGRGSVAGLELQIYLFNNFLRKAELSLVQ
jgi:hypothetical protein